MSHHIVEVRDLHFVYPDGKAALNGVTFRISHGESVALVGANGAGKSTLLLHLNGCYAPTGGAVRIGDHEVTQKNLTEVRKSVGMVFQDSDDQLFLPTVGDDVAFGPLNLGFSADEVARRVDEALRLVDAVRLKARQPHRLSGGEKRMAAIATILAMGPEILVMDEPSSNLDPRARRRLIDLLRSFRHTKILATHDLDMVLDLCQRTIVLKEGRVVADGPTLEVFRNEEVLAASHLEKPLRMQGCPSCSPEKPSVQAGCVSPLITEMDHRHEAHDLPHEHDGEGPHYHHHGHHEHKE